jgi:hypothetical protein
MFYVKKDSIDIKTRTSYPFTVSDVGQTIYIDGFGYRFFGDSKVKCDKGDVFSVEFGKELAETNALIKMLKEYKRALIDISKQPEWRLEPAVKKVNKNKKEYIVEPRSNYHDWEGVKVNMFNNSGDKTYKFTVEEVEGGSIG